jgi:hypothetical protein
MSSIAYEAPGPPDRRAEQDRGEERADDGVHGGQLRHDGEDAGQLEHVDPHGHGAAAAVLHDAQGEHRQQHRAAHEHAGAARVLPDDLRQGRHHRDRQGEPCGPSCGRPSSLPGPVRVRTGCDALDNPPILIDYRYIEKR